MNCKNCHTDIPERSGYCSRCGAKVIRNRLTMKNLISSFSRQFFDYDNKFLQTFINLFKKPEDVIGSYINGTRKKYVNVISYYAIAISLAGIQLFVLNKFFPENARSICASYRRCHLGDATEEPELHARVPIIDDDALCADLCLDLSIGIPEEQEIQLYGASRNFLVYLGTTINSYGHSNDNRRFLRCDAWGLVNHILAFASVVLCVLLKTPLWS